MIRIKQNRRKFISTVAAASAAIPFASLSGVNVIYKQPAKRFPLRLFSKPLDTYDFSFMCECAVRSGIQGLDLTVRPRGYVEPSDVETKLPLLVSEAKKHNLALDMIVSGIVNASEPLTKRILKTASSLGVTHYRLGYMQFDFKVGVWESLQNLKKDFKDLAALNMKYNIHGDYQNHAGARVGGPVWDLYELLKDFSPDSLGCQYDVRHAMVEGANAWIVGMQLIAPYIKTLAIKDFTWKTDTGIPRAVTVPMGEGMVNWDFFFKTVKDLDLSCPMTLHVEYPLFERGEEKLSFTQQQDILVRKIKKDVDFLNEFIIKYELN